MTMKKLEKHLPATGKILDLGSATGVYAFPLAEKGFQVYLVDLSERLIDIARQKKVQSGADHLISCYMVNAIDLSIYDKEDRVYSIQDSVMLNEMRKPPSERK